MCYLKLIVMNKNLTISFDEKDLEKYRKFAASNGLSLNALIRELLNKVSKKKETHWIEEFFQLADEAKLSSKGKKWRREDLYER